MPFSISKQDLSIRIPLGHVQDDDDHTFITATFVIPSPLDPQNLTRKRQNRVVTLLHGGRNPIYQQQLADRLATDHGLYVLCFDFRADVDVPAERNAIVDAAAAADSHTNADAGVVNAEKATDSEVADLEVVMNYLLHERNLVIAGMVGHGKGSDRMLKWALHQQSTSKESDDCIFVPSLVSCSGRFNATATTTATTTIQKYGDLRPDSAMLTVHGSLDTVVGVENAYKCHEVMGSRGNGNGNGNSNSSRHTLEIIENAGHDLSQCVDQVVDIITDYFSISQENKRFLIAHETLGGHSPRFINTVQGAVNLRDFGGFPVKPTEFSKKTNINNNGGGCRHRQRQRVKTGILFRAAKLDLVSNPQQVYDLGIRQVYDLRSTVELEVTEFSTDGLFHYSPQPDQQQQQRLTTTHVPVFGDGAYSPEVIAVRFHNYGANGFTKAYTEILESGGTSAFYQMFIYLRDNPNTGLIIHCTAGKDRTGIFAMLVLLLLGVEVDTVAHEYELTTLGYATERAKMLKKVLAMSRAAAETNQGNGGLLKESRPLPSYLTDMTVEGWDNLLSSRYETMVDTVVEVVQGRYGGVERYLMEVVGLTREDLERVRENLLVEDEMK